MVSLTWAHFLSLAVLALAGAGHCAGMCGGFALGAAAPGRPGSHWVRLGMYHGGKTLSYVFLGLVLLLGLETLYSREWLVEVQRWLGLGLAVLMATLGLSYLFGWRWAGPWERSLGRVSGCAAGLALGQASLGRALFLGWLNGLLPCGLSMAAMVYVLRFRAVGDVVLGLVWFGLMTVPVMALLVWLGARATVAQRQRWLRWGGLALLGGAVLTALRSVPGAHTWLQQALGMSLGGPLSDPWCN